MRYMILIKHAESIRSQEIPRGLLEAMGDFVGGGLESGKIKETAGLKASAAGFRIRSEGGQLRVTDGPFTESKELVGGFAIIEVDSDREAREWSRQFMELHRVHFPEFVGECEVRPYEDM